MFRYPVRKLGDYAPADTDDWFVLFDKNWTLDLDVEDTSLLPEQLDEDGHLTGRWSWANSLTNDRLTRR